jgi:hypothetical protein
MLALYRSGRQAEALSVYAATKQRLGDELGLDPGPELRELETAMLRHDPMLLGTASHASAADGATGGHRRVSARPDDVMTALRRTAMWAALRSSGHSSSGGAQCWTVTSAPHLSPARPASARAGWSQSSRTGRVGPARRFS